MNTRALNIKYFTERLDQTIGLIRTAITSGTSVRELAVETWNGPNLPIGSKIIIEPLNQNIRYQATTTTNVTTGSTSIGVDLFNTSSTILSQSKIYFDKFNNHDRMYKQYNSTHVHLYHTGTTHGNDVLPNFAQFNFNINAGSVLSDGDSKPNRWGSQFAFWVAPDYNCKIERIIMHGSSNGGLNEDWAIRYWKKPVTENGTTATDLSLITTHSCTSVNNQNHVFTNRYDPTTKYSLDKGDTILITFLKTGTSKVSSTKFYSDIEILTSYYIK